MRNTEKYIVGQTYQGRAEVSGISFTLIKRVGDLCLFERGDGYLEVIELRQQKERTVIMAGAEVRFKAKEVYPMADSWDGKCISSPKRANELFLKTSREQRVLAL